MRKDRRGLEKKKKKWRKCPETEKTGEERGKKNNMGDSKKKEKRKRMREIKEVRKEEETEVNESQKRKHSNKEKKTDIFSTLLLLFLPVNIKLVKPERRKLPYHLYVTPLLLLCVLQIMSVPILQDILQLHYYYKILGCVSVNLLTLTQC